MLPPSSPLLVSYLKLCLLVSDFSWVNGYYLNCVNIFAYGVTSDFEFFEEMLHLHSMRGQKKGSDFIQALITMWLWEAAIGIILVGRVIDGAPSVIGSKNGIVSPLQTYAWVRTPE